MTENNQQAAKPGKAPEKTLSEDFKVSNILQINFGTRTRRFRVEKVTRNKLTLKSLGFLKQEDND